MTKRLGERLRAANPVPTTRLVSPDERLLLDIVGTGRIAGFRRRRAGRRVLVLVAAIVIVVGGMAAAFSRFVPNYFDSEDSASVPETVLAQLRSLTPEERSIEGGLGQLDVDGLVRLASFDAPEGLATIYAAPTMSGAGFCEVHTIDDIIGGGGCYGDRTWQAFPHIFSGDSEWGDVRLLLGVIEPPTARIEVRFEDGSARAPSVQGPWWAYVVGGEEMEPGRRPIQLIAFEQNGGVVGSEEYDPRHLGRP